MVFAGEGDSIVSSTFSAEILKSHSLMTVHGRYLGMRKMYIFIRAG
jgi:hypothetical protein